MPVPELMPLSTASESKLLSAVLAGLVGPVFVCDGQGQIRKVNPALEQLVGRTEEDLMGRPCWEALFPGEEAAAIRERYHRLGNSDEMSPVEITFTDDQGNPSTILWSHTLVRSPAGDVTLVLAAGTDVTELRRLEREATERKLEEAARQAREEALQSSEARFSGIVELASDAIISVDESHRIVVFNQGAEVIFGYRPEEILGRPLDLLLPSHARDAHRGHLETFHRSPVPSRRLGERTAISGLRKNGEEFAAEASILKLEVEGRRLFTVLLRDISARVKREAGQRFLAKAGAALASSLESEETLRCIAEQTVAEIADFCLIDLMEGSGGSRHLEAIHRDPGQKELAEAFQSLSMDQAHFPVLSAVMETGRPELVAAVTPEHLAEWCHEKEQLGWLQKLAPRSYMAVPLLARGRTVGALLCVRSGQSPGYDEQDLELAVELGRRAGVALENARLYREARDAVLARDDVLGIVSHDLGNPLQAIFIGLEALERTRSSRGEGQAGSEEYYLSAIRRSADAMERLIRDLVEIRRMEAGHLSLDPVRQALLPLVEEALEVMDPLARVKGVEIQNHLDSSRLPEVTVDPDRIQQVLSNLVGNAVKHTPEGGRVTIIGECGEREVRITVRDTGPGIPEEDLAFVFDRFWRGSTGRGRGIGLGLAIARGIVQAHGGKIWAESTPGEGSAFTFTLPLGSPDPEEGSETVPARVPHLNDSRA
ncbi:MAG: PAS domain S-box protein [Gemmatimonadales bacterium]|nr:MAG: PAS domain S-box protein [Gemmatimonadales bacterium]